MNTWYENIPININNNGDPLLDNQIKETVQKIKSLNGLEELKTILHTAIIENGQDPLLSTFTYTLSLFDKHDDYVFVLAMDKEQNTIYVEDGVIKSKELNLFLKNLMNKLQTIHL